MELLRLSGYTEEEKEQIARRYLLPRRLKEIGLKPGQFVLPDEVLQAVIERYTREAGVRELERMLGTLTRKSALRVAEGTTASIELRIEDLAEMLGPERFFFERARQALPAGVATGLAWTQAGGDVLYVESVGLPGRDGQLTLTGQLGEVMRESAQAAQSYITSHSAELGIDPPHLGVHIHVPAGAVPKDGPSAGVTMAVSLASLYSGYQARSDTAMTGEITLSGLVLPVGGIKEKVLAARRAGIRRVILPRENGKDLRTLPPEVQNEIEFTFVDRISSALADAIPELAPRIHSVEAG
jgi:ATP-dependent Lon protease